MKTKVLIILFLILSLLGAFTLKANAQHVPASLEKEGLKGKLFVSAQRMDSAILICDETWLTYSKTGAKVLTYSEKAFQDISLKYATEFKSIHIKNKSDRSGKYREYTIYLSKETAYSLYEWSKKNL